MELFFPLILDGANGTELQKRGYDSSVCTESWVLDHPDVMQQLQREYVEAGSNVIYAPTFGANRIKLEENGIFNQVADYNKRLVALSKEVANSANKVLVAGDIASTGKFIAPLGELTFDDLYEIYHEQAAALEEAGVDLFVIETLMTIPDARAALLAVKDFSDKPVLVSFTCDENGKTLTGTDICAALVIMQAMGADAFGLNCSTGPKEMIDQFRRLREFAEVPLAVKPNAGLPKTIDGKLVYDCTPEEFCTYTGEFNKAGAVIFGGCCGTGPDYIRGLANAMQNFELVKPAPQHRDSILCATEKKVFIIDGELTAEKMLTCEPGLERQIKKENKSDASVIAIEISAKEDLDEFETAQYMIKKPLCLVCNDAKLLEEALRLYQGRAIYAGALETEDLLPLTEKYGLII